MPKIFQNPNIQQGKISARQVFALVAIVFVIIIISYSLVRFLLDQYNYQKAHQAYSQYDCETAVPSYDKILNRYRLIDLAGVYALALEENTECVYFLEAAEKQQYQKFGQALLAYMDFIKVFRGSILVQEARYRSHSLFNLTTPSTLASQDTCSQIPSLLEENLIPQKDMNLSLLYLACGLVYDEASMRQKSYDMYEAFLNLYPDNPFAQTVETNLIANPVACEKITPLKNNSVISTRLDFLPKLYMSCGQFYISRNDSETAFEMYINLLEEYPQHSFTVEVENFFFSFLFTCEKIDSFTSNAAISTREDFIPRLLYNCGQMYEKEGDWNTAIKLYKDFLDSYPDHSLVTDVEAGLARSIVGQAVPIRGGEISPPKRIGNTNSNFAEVTIYNNSPERIRIVFSGPVAQIVEIEACSSCTTYLPWTEPESCLSSPRGTYTLTPGEYSVVVEVVSEERIRPWTGNWFLEGGSLYGDKCFYIETQIIQ